MPVLKKGENDILTLNPELAKEWNVEKNYPLKASDVSCKTSKKFWWKCSKGHEWEATPNNRNSGTGCPYCAGRLPIKGETDLETLFPEIASEWNYDKNNGLYPCDFTYGSSKKVWWICDKGHEWESSIAHRTGGRGCPICKGGNSTSFPEQVIYYYAKKFFPNTMNRYKIQYKGTRIEVDVYIPEIDIAIEYDGQAYHKDVKKDELKDLALSELGIQLIRIREPKCPPLKKTRNIFIIEKVSGRFYYEEAIKRVFSYILKKDIYESINIRRDYNQILSSYEHLTKKNSIMNINPEILKEWDYEKNGNLAPSHISFGSNILIWWKCSLCGAKWQATVKHRNNGRGCPKCGRKSGVDKRIQNIIHEGKSFKSWCEENKERGAVLLRQWSDKNKVNPENVSYGSNTKILWRCQFKHEWTATINNRVNGTDCPYCSNKITLSGYNDLVTTHKELMNEWDYEKNIVDPHTIRYGSNKKVWWRCSKGHSWEALICNRTTNGSGCPFCSGKRVLRGFNDLSTVAPHLLSEWDFSNNLISPDDVTAGTTKKAWWICKKCGYKWYAIIGDRVSGHGCPRCARIKAARSPKKKNK